MTSTSSICYIPLENTGKSSSSFYYIPRQNTGKSIILQEILRKMLEDKLPTHFICDVELLTLGRVFNTFQVINLYEDEFSEATIIPNFYDISFNF